LVLVQHSPYTDSIVLSIPSMQKAAKLFFLPGALGRTEFWHPAAALLTCPARIPTLLLWGDADPISPVQVGQRLAGLLPQSALYVLPGADHALGSTHAHLVAPLIDRHLSAQP
jgi:pimeloyl-ACP methyl ester carboxylesterase